MNKTWYDKGQDWTRHAGRETLDMKTRDVDETQIASWTDLDDKSRDNETKNATTDDKDKEGKQQNRKEGMSRKTKALNK